jgi:acyl-CoA reductase-like NAD-dependent aldehyde dehydrogenase
MYAFDAGAPFGGYKNSGIGRESGPEGIAGTAVKSAAAAVRLHPGVPSREQT